MFLYHFQTASTKTVFCFVWTLKSNRFSTGICTTTIGKPSRHRWRFFARALKPTRITTMSSFMVYRTSLPSGHYYLTDPPIDPLESYRTGPYIHPWIDRRIPSSNNDRWVDCGGLIVVNQMSIDSKFDFINQKSIDSNIYFVNQLLIESNLGVSKHSRFYMLKCGNFSTLLFVEKILVVKGCVIVSDGLTTSNS